MESPTCAQSITCSDICLLVSWRTLIFLFRIMFRQSLTLNLHSAMEPGVIPRLGPQPFPCPLPRPLSSPKPSAITLSRIVMTCQLRALDTVTSSRFASCSVSPIVNVPPLCTSVTRMHWAVFRIPKSNSFVTTCPEHFIADSELQTQEYGHHLYYLL